MEGVAIPSTCKLCYKCIDVCPEEALSKNTKTGAVQVDNEKCTACGLCVEVCPFSVMFIHPEKRYVITCDLCNGNPQCVKYCPENALQYMTAKDFAKYKQEIKIQNMSENKGM